ncbi:MAG: DUF2846 domain-containing protein [SAR324 cluster bacterium]|nr:DUF2846 domain-containing protein [SAR324 cluster bacterium]
MFIQKMFLTGYILITATILVSCSATGPLFKESSKVDDWATVYIYRPRVFCLSARKPDIYINGVKIIELQNNGYTSFRLKPNTNLIESKGLNDSPSMHTKINFELFDTNQYYIEYHIVCNWGIIGMNGYAIFKVKEKIVALPEISQTHYQAPLIEYVESSTSQQ